MNRRPLRPGSTAAVLALLATAAPVFWVPAGLAQQPPQVAAGGKKSPAGRVLLVGPGRGLAAPSAAARIARPGDTIRIDAGEYVDCAVWRVGPLTIEGVGGYAHVRDKSCGGKAIWVFYAAPVTISNVRFSGSRVRHRNGAGIRWEGHGLLVVKNGWFHNNQMGILTHNERSSSLVLRDCRFERNGDCREFCGHGVYAGFISTLVIINSVFEGHRHGHHVKSRALTTRIIGNRISDGADGTSSFAIDLPNSGTALIRHNFMQKGPGTGNALGMIAIGEESASNASRAIVIENNVFQNDNRRATNFVWNRSPHPATVRLNRYSGPGRKLRGPGRVLP